MRIALLASPRYGNNWVHWVISDVLGYPHFAAHSIEEFPLALPPDCILNIHALNNAPEREFFEKRSCILVALTRHPLDIFVSVLQFARHEPAVHKWLNGSCRIPYEVQNLCPDDVEYVRWMSEDGASNLLSPSHSWWTYEKTLVRLRYEELVRSPQETFNNLFERIGAKPKSSLQQALDNYPVSYFAQFKNHGWLGKSCTYVKFITKANCELVYTAKQMYFMTGGYEIQGDEALTHEVARERYFASITAGPAAS